MPTLRGKNREAIFRELAKRQGGVCAICGDLPSPGRRLAVDHDHACCGKGRFCESCARGLLCTRCNVGLGYFQDSAHRLGLAARYLGGTGDVDKDPLVGKWFHSFFDPCATCGDRIVRWQGRVVAAVGSEGYLVETFSWLTGVSYSDEVVGRGDVVGWRISRSGEEAQRTSDELWERSTKHHTRCGVKLAA